MPCTQWPWIAEECFFVKLDAAHISVVLPGYFGTGNAFFATHPNTFFVSDAIRARSVPRTFRGFYCERVTFFILEPVLAWD